MRPQSWTIDVDCREKPLENRKVRNYGAGGMDEFDFQVGTTNYSGPSPLLSTPQSFSGKLVLLLFFLSKMIIEHFSS